MHLCFIQEEKLTCLITIVIAIIGWVLWKQTFEMDLGVQNVYQGYIHVEKRGKKQSWPEGEVRLQCRPDKALAKMTGVQEQVLPIRAIVHWAQVAMPLFACLTQLQDMATPGKV